MVKELVSKDNIKKYEAVYQKNIRDHWYPNENIVRLTKSFFGDGPGLVLVHGCGSSENMQHLMRLNYDVYGTEIVKEAIEECELKINNHSICNKPYSTKWKLFLINTDDKNLPFEDNTFDHILCNQIIYFLGSLDNIEHLLLEFRRVLKSNGKLIITMSSLHNLQMIREGVRIEKNIWNWHDMNVYIFDDKKHISDVFGKYMDIVEIGYFDLQYLNLSGHHWVIMAKNNKN